MIKKISKEEALKKINTVLDKGIAAEKFEKMVDALGGPSSILNTYKEILSAGLYVKEIFVKETGWIKKINTRKLGLLLIELGGGRKQSNDKINYHVGYNNIASVGDKIDDSTPIVKVFSKSEDAFNTLKDEIRECFTLQDQEVKKLKNIYEVIK